MAETYTLEAQPRTIIGKKVRQLRVQGIVPVVVYGARTQPVNLQVPYRALQLTLLNAGGTHVININVSDGKSYMAIAREVQRDVLRGDIMHVDFLAIDATTRIRTNVPVSLVGESPAVQMGLGILLAGTSSVEIEALPANLIERIEVDLSRLKGPTDSIHVRDLNLGPDITIYSDGDEMLVRITQSAAQESQEALSEAPTSAEPEVISKGKQEEEDF